MNIILRALTKLEYTFKYPFSNEESKYGSAIQGIICVLLSPFIIPLLILIGYRLKLIESVIDKTQAPKFESYDELFEEGLTGFFVYLPIFSLIMLGLSLTFIGLPIFMGISIIGLYIWPATSIIYSIKRDYKQVYGPDFAELISSPLYMRTYIGSVLITILLFITISMFGIPTLGLGFIIIIPTYIYSKPILWGQMYNEHDIKILN